MRAVAEAADRGDADARLAVDVWLHRLCAAIAAMTASAGGLDVLVFTGGIGEHSPSLRAAAAHRLGWLGVAISSQAEDDRDGQDADVSPCDATVRTLVVNAREDIEIARGVRAAIDGD
jgi:acetate kinase